MIYRKALPLVLCALMLMSSAYTQEEDSDVTVQIDPVRASDWTVSKHLFGWFFEYNRERSVTL